MKAVLYSPKFAVVPARPYTLAFRMKGDITGFVRTDFFAGDLLKFNFDVRRLKAASAGEKDYLLKAVTWRGALQGQVVFEIFGSRNGDTHVTLSELKLFVGDREY